MRSRRATLILLLIVAGLFALAAFARPRLPQTPLIDSDNMSIARTYQLDQTVDDSLFIVAEAVELLENSHITGDAAFVSGDVQMEGQIDGDLTVTGEIVTLLPSARVGGDVTLIAENARIDGEVTGDITFSGEHLFLAPDVVLSGSIGLCSGEVTDQRVDVVAEYGPCANLDLVSLVESLRSNVALQSSAATTDSAGRLIFALIGAVFVAFLMSAISTLSVTLFPAHLGAMERALHRPQSQFVTGLLTVVLLVGLAAAVVVLMAVAPALAVVLVPVAFAVGVGFLALAVAGAIPITLMLGEWLLGRVSTAQWPPLIAAPFGSLTLALALALPVFVPYGALVSLTAAGLIGTVALGAALSTRLGTRGQRASYFVQG